jgi:DNA-binding PadR family transcriptional regulator
MGRAAKSPRELVTTAALHVLMAVAGQDLHGSGIRQAVEDRTGGRMRLGPGTLYEAIHRMEAAGWIRGVESPEGSGAKLRYYRITAAGRRIMEDELTRLAEVVHWARAEALLPEEGS